MPKVDEKDNLDFANFSAATAMHTTGEDWRLGTTVNLAAAAAEEEERLWIDQSGTLATKVTESRHRGTASRFLQTGGF